MKSFAGSLPIADILVVDDVPHNLRLFTEILGGQGYRVRPAINGQVALKAARLHPPHLILLDIMMPGLNGYEVGAQLQADARTRHIPIIFVSALQEDYCRAKARAVGGVDYIAKPIQAENLLDRVAA